MSSEAAETTAPSACEKQELSLPKKQRAATDSFQKRKAMRKGTASEPYPFVRPAYFHQRNVSAMKKMPRTLIAIAT